MKAIRCRSCGIYFGPFGTAADLVADFKSHPCMIDETRDRARALHPSTVQSSGGAA